MTAYITQIALYVINSLALILHCDLAEYCFKGIQCSIAYLIEIYIQLLQNTFQKGIFRQGINAS